MRLLKNPVFYVSFVIFFLISLYSFGWNFLGIWTYKKGERLTDVYVKTSVVDDTAIRLVFAGIDLLQGDYSQYAVLKSVIETLKQAEILLKLDVIEYLLSSADKNTALETLLIRLQKTIDDLKTYKSEVNGLLTMYEQQYQSCLAEKKLGDANFFYGLRNYDYQLLVEGLEQSAKGGGCAEENRIRMHAYQIIYQRIDTYLNLLEQKFHILNSNQTLIVQNIELFKDNYLEKLLSLKEAVKTLSYDITN